MIYVWDSSLKSDAIIRYLADENRVIDSGQRFRLAHTRPVHIHLLRTDEFQLKLKIEPLVEVVPIGEENLPHVSLDKAHFFDTIVLLIQRIAFIWTEFDETREFNLIRYFFIFFAKK